MPLGARPIPQPKPKPKLKLKPNAKWSLLEVEFFSVDLHKLPMGVNIWAACPTEKPQNLLEKLQIANCSYLLEAWPDTILPKLKINQNKNGVTDSFYMQKL